MGISGDGRGGGMSDLIKAPRASAGGEGGRSMLLDVSSEESWGQDLTISMTSDTHCVMRLPAEVQLPSAC